MRTGKCGVACLPESSGRVGFLGLTEGRVREWGHGRHDAPAPLHTQQPRLSARCRDPGQCCPTPVTASFYGLTSCFWNEEIEAVGNDG